MNGYLKNEIYLRSWGKMVNKVVTMFSQAQWPLNKQTDTRGIRLEDVKRNPSQTMPQIAAWMGINDHPTLYESTFCGLQYWGPSSKATGKITGFNTKAIDQPVGRLLGSRDVVIFETLFWPLSSLYAYTELDHAGFLSQLVQIRPWLDEPLEFEKQLYDEMNDHSRSIKDLAPYKRLHHLILRLWTLLDRNYTYCNLVSPMKLDF